MCMYVVYSLLNVSFHLFQKWQQNRINIFHRNGTFYTAFFWIFYMQYFIIWSWTVSKCQTKMKMTFKILSIVQIVSLILLNLGGIKSFILFCKCCMCVYFVVIRDKQLWYKYIDIRHFNYLISTCSSLYIII